MFWGLILQPNRKYILNEVEMSFHISMAVLHTTIDDNQTVNVMVSKEGVNFLLCTLEKGFNCQSQLNLNFEKGSKVSFFCSGKNNVHLTGYFNKPYDKKLLQEDKETTEIIANGKENEKKENEEEENEKEQIEKEENEKEEEGTKKYSLANDKQLKRKAIFSPKPCKLKRIKCDNDDVDIPKRSMNKGTDNSDAKETTDEEEEPEEEVEVEVEVEEEEEEEEDEEEQEEEEKEEEEEEEEEKEEKEEQCEGEEEEEEQCEGEEEDNDDDDEDDDDYEVDDKDDCDGEDDSNNEDEDEDSDDEDEDSDDEDDDYSKLKLSKKTIDDFENKKKKIKGDNSFEYNLRKKLKKSKDTVVETKKQSKNQRGETLTKENFQIKKHKKKSAFVKIIDIKKGTGAIAKEGKMVSIYYVGRLKNGDKYTEKRSGNGLQFTIGKNEVVEGLNLGVEGMRVGGKRRILVPPSLGYGKKGFLPCVPPNSNIIFEVELRYVR